MKGAFIALGKIYPKGIRKKLDETISYAGWETHAEEWAGRFVLFQLIIVLIGLLIWRINWILPFDIIWFILAISVTLVVLEVLVFYVPYYAGEKRARFVESVLPSFYQLMASYLRSGMTPYQALKATSKPQFGILEDEIQIATSKGMGTESFSDALLGMSRNIHSENLKRTTELMVRGMDNGGSLSRLLEESATNLIENESMRKQVIASSKTYSMMVIFAVLVGTPLLLSIAQLFNVKLLEIAEGASTGGAAAARASMGMLAGSSALDPAFLTYSGIAIIAITALISSFLVAVIATGKMKHGIKYAIVFIPVALALYFGFTAALSTIL